MTKFEVGKLYAQEYACGDGRYPMECVKRTGKTMEAFDRLMETSERFNREISLLLEEQHKLLNDINSRLDKITEAQK
jgi:hypothetical protein